jgi:ubiquinol-cytochrome c reductase cytochrome b subunit
MFGAIAVLFILPWLDRSPVRSARFRPLFRIFFWLLLIDAVVLGYLGGKPAEGIYVVLSRVATAWYFLHFLVILPLLSVFETTKPLPKSISEPVLRSSSSLKAPMGAGLEPAE